MLLKGAQDLDLNDGLPYLLPKLRSSIRARFGWSTRCIIPGYCSRALRTCCSQDRGHRHIAVLFLKRQQFQRNAVKLLSVASLAKLADETCNIGELLIQLYQAFRPFRKYYDKRLSFDFAKWEEFHGTVGSQSIFPWPDRGIQNYVLPWEVFFFFYCCSNLPIGKRILLVSAIQAYLLRRS